MVANAPLPGTLSRDTRPENGGSHAHPGALLKKSNMDLRGKRLATLHVTRSNHIFINVLKGIQIEATIALL